MASLDGREAKFRHQALPRFLRRHGSADEPDDPVDMVQSLEQALQDVGPVFGLLQLIAATPPNHLTTMVNKASKGICQVEDARLALGDGEHDHPEAALHRGELVEIVQDDFRLFAAPQLNHDAHAVPIRLIAQIRNAVDSLALDQVRNLLDQLGLVDLERDLPDYNHVPVAVRLLLNGGPGPDDDRAPTRRVGPSDPFSPIDHPPGGEIRPRH